MLVHCRALIDGAGPACVAVKPQLACFERLGSAGWLALEATCAYARAAGLLVLADGKRGDVPVTATAYAQGLRRGARRRRSARVAGLDVDALTANPLLGRDAARRRSSRVPAPPAPASSCSCARPTRAPPTSWICHSPTGEPLWERLAALAHELGEAEPGGLADVGAVTGATAPEHLARMRELMPRTPFLLPGVGAQGGDVASLAPAFAPGRAGGLVTASRSIANAYEQHGGNPADAARAEAERLRERSRGIAAVREGRRRGIIASMARRSPARLLAPLALVGFVIALLVVINGAGSDGGSETAPEPSRAATRDRRRPRRSRRPGAGARRYTVKAGDTPSGIAEKTGVPLSQILELNPDLDDQTLTVGDKLKLRP